MGKEIPLMAVRCENYIEPRQDKIVINYYEILNISPDVKEIELFQEGTTDGETSNGEESHRSIKEKTCVKLHDTTIFIPKNKKWYQSKNTTFKKECDNSITVLTHENIVIDNIQNLDGFIGFNKEIEKYINIEGVPFVYFIKSINGIAYAEDRDHMERLIGRSRYKDGDKRITLQE